mmetsp:Transcript_6333/g.15326  ORF Transcript_6333/g.15326 Transcript_6333/m.15326 type:complete len:302 (-) Transcript_6333:130-1035(-)
MRLPDGVYSGRLWGLHFVPHGLPGRPHPDLLQGQALLRPRGRRRGAVVGHPHEHGVLPRRPQLLLLGAHPGHLPPQADCPHRVRDRRVVRGHGPQSLRHDCRPGRQRRACQVVAAGYVGAVDRYARPVLGVVPLYPGGSVGVRPDTPAVGAGAAERRPDAGHHRGAHGAHRDTRLELPANGPNAARRRQRPGAACARLAGRPHGLLREPRALCALWGLALSADCRVSGCVGLQSWASDVRRHSALVPHRRGFVRGTCMPVRHSVLAGGCGAGAPCCCRDRAGSAPDVEPGADCDKCACLGL